MRGSVVALVALLSPLASWAGKYNDVLDLGAAAPAWNMLPGVDDKKHSFSDLKDKEVVVVVFTCVSCPASEDYQERLLAFVKKYAGPQSKVGVVAINCNTNPEDRLPKMKERAEESGFTFPFLYDESQKMGRLYGAVYTPEFFVLNQDRKVVYMGAMDDKDNAKQVTRRFVEEAVEATLKRQLPEVGETLARGCRIRFNRVKN